MKKSFFFICILFTTLYSCKKAAPTEDATDVKQYTIEQFMNNVSYNGGAFSHDDSKILVTSNKSGIFNAYEIPVTGGEPKALTNSTGSSVFAISYFPNDDRILYQQDDNGNEILHLFVRNTDGSSVELTPDSAARAQFYGWSYDRKSFYYGYNKRNPGMMDVFEMDIATLQPKLLYEMKEALDFNGISPDKKYMVLGKAITTNDNDLYLYDFQKKTMQKISQNQAAHSLADFSPDGKFMYYLTDDGSEFAHLVKYELATGKREKALEEKWDIAYAYFSQNGKYQVIGTNEDGKTVVRIMNMETGDAVDFPDFGDVDITSVNISDREKLMTFYLGGSGTPSDLYVYNIESGESKQLTNSLNPEIDPEDLVTATVVRYKSFDGVEIPAIYYKPKQASAQNKVPALVWVHGGPGGQTRQTYSAQIQYLVNHGYAVLGVNNRGSSGYGKTFFNMDNKNHGEKDLQDCVEGKNWLAQQAYIDSSKIGIIGGSYGGFMVMAALVHQPEAFDVGVNIFGVTNWIRTLKSIPPWWESNRKALYDELGDPYNPQDSARLYRISPLFHPEKITKPVMVLQGSKDPRVLQVESDEIVAAAKKNGVPVEYVLFPDEGHGFVKKENQIEAYSKVLEFLDKYLKKKEQLKG
ncbi:MAG: alpha/beta fold hydrolase [Saprospiraceae bacterium]